MLCEGIHERLLACFLLMFVCWESKKRSNLNACIRSESTMNGTEFLSFYILFIKFLLILVAVIFFISGLDDFFVDLYYLCRTFYRKLFIIPKYTPLTEEQLKRAVEKPLCVMIPAWDESTIIRQMIENFLKTVQYSNYYIFIGCYANDPATRNEIDKVRSLFKNVERIVCPKDGPTNKSDCLNWVYQGVKLFEKEHGIEFAGYVLHDAEDIPHPLSLKLYNYLLPRKDMIQLPVFPLEQQWYKFTTGHYKDEFAENHYKDLVVREIFSKHVPCAGVGCAFSRKALDAIAQHYNNQIFNIDSLTEDYDLSFRIQSLGMKQVFVRQAIERVTTTQSFWTRKTKQKKVKEFIATREYFPATFMASVRQKSRWVVGIALQGWKNLQWRGPLAIKYVLFRDRKSLITNQANALGYLVVFSIIALWLTNRFYPESYRYPGIIDTNSWVWYLILIDTFFMVQRLNMRAYCVKQIYGWRQALLSVPRQIWSNVINFFAVMRSLYLYANYLLTGTMIRWDKTHHVFPSEAELKTFKRKLGDLLLEKRMITVEQLEQALSIQKNKPQKLGRILVNQRMIQEQDLVNMLGVQSQTPVCDIDPYRVPVEVIRLVPKEIAVRYSVFPIENNGQLVLAVSSEHQLSSDEAVELSSRLGRSIKFRLTTRNNLAFAIQRGYARLGQEPNEPHGSKRLGERLVESRLISQEHLDNALRLQRQTYQRLGDILVEENIMTEEQLKNYLTEYCKEKNSYFGEFLIANQYITKEQFEIAMTIQKSRFQKLGEILVEQNMISKDVLDDVLAAHN